MNQDKPLTLGRGNNYSLRIINYELKRSDMTHIAIQEQLDGKPVDWLEQVSDEQYQAALKAE